MILKLASNVTELVSPVSKVVKLSYICSFLSIFKFIHALKQNTQTANWKKKSENALSVIKTGLLIYFGVRFKHQSVNIYRIFTLEIAFKNTGEPESCPSLADPACVRFAWLLGTLLRRATTLHFCLYCLSNCVRNYLRRTRTACLKLVSGPTDAINWLVCFDGVRAN